MTDIFVISFANKKNILSSNLENTLKKYNYDYEIIGDGLKWENFMTKIRECYKYIKSNKDFNKNTVIAIVDCYDLFACDSPKKLIKKFKSFDKKIVAGAESMCLGNCIPLNSYYRYHDMKKNHPYQYANGGFYIGYKEYILDMLHFMLKLNNPDDQIALCKYINKYPKNVGIDTTGSMVSNITLYSYFDSYWNKKKNKVKNTLTNEYPCFVHTPGADLDCKYRYDYFGEKILGTKHKSDKTNNVKKMISNYKYVVLIIIILLILLIYLIFFYQW